MQIHTIIDPYALRHDGGNSPTADIDWGGFDLINAGIIQAGDFAKTGWPVTSGVTLSFVNGTRIFTVTDGGSAYYYIDGVKYVLGGNKTVTIDDTEGLWYIYFVGATLTASQAIWSFRDEDKALVSILYWDATNNEEIFLGHELHSFHMDGSTHARLHYAGGARWETGLLVSDAGSELINVSAGDIWDEDLNIPVTDGAGAGLFEQVLSPAELPIYYRDGASDWRIYETADKANATDAGYIDGSNDLKYNKLNGTWANATVTTGKYVAYWAIATNDQTEPVALIMGQRIDTTLANAKENNVFSGLSLSGLPFQEMIVLARLLLKDTGSGVYYTLEEVLDLRAASLGGNITSPLITDHGGLGGLGDSADHQWALLIDGTRALAGAWDMGSQNLTNVGDLTFNNTATQDWLVTGSFASLALQAQSSATATRLQLYSKDGDETDDIMFEVYTDGTPGAIGNAQWMRQGWNASSTTFQIQVGKSGSGGNRSLKIQTTGKIELVPTGVLELEGSQVGSDTIRTDTTATAANVNIGTGLGGPLKRVTSSARYKIVDSDMTAEKAACILSLVPKKYYSKCLGDDPAKPFYGLVADDVAEVFPEAVVYDPNGLVENYDINFIMAAAVKCIQALHAQNADFEERLKELEK